MIRFAGPADIDSVRKLFREYAAWVGSAICFEAFNRELADLPGRYVPLLIAFHEDQAAGCAALRDASDGVGELKRLYVRPAFQGFGLGRALVERVIAEAKAAGYQTLRLDTLPMMQGAIALYRSFGFREIPPYGNNPPEAICFELSLHCQ